MPKREQRAGTKAFDQLVPAWERLLIEAIKRADPELSSSDASVAIFHLSKHSVRIEDPPPPDAAPGVVGRIDCALGQSCKAYAAAQALMHLLDAKSDEAEEVRRMAKAMSRARAAVWRIAVEYEKAVRQYVPAQEKIHARHADMPPGMSLGHYSLCRQPFLVLNHFHHFLLQVAEKDHEILHQLPAPYRGAFQRKDTLALLDIVTAPLLPAFTDAEIATMLPDGKSGDDRQRVSNRRLKLTGSRSMPDGSKRPK